jgi:Calcineurin-like phosphoesterase
MKQLIIGDIHGCYDELQDLLDKAALATDDQIIAIGDIIDRGRDSARALAFFQQTPNARSILGNHERKHIRWLRGEIEPAVSQIIAREQIGNSYPEAVAFMDTFPRFLELPDALLVHGFYEPGVPVEKQRETVIVGTLSGEKYIRDYYPWPWYEQYDGEKPLIVGHRDYSDDRMEPVVYRERVYMIDSRCVYGGSLTGLLLPDFKLISVPSRGDHWGTMLEQYADVIRQYEAK